MKKCTCHLYGPNTCPRCSNEIEERKQRTGYTLEGYISVPQWLIQDPSSVTARTRNENERSSARIESSKSNTPQKETVSVAGDGGQGQPTTFSGGVTSLPDGQETMQ